MPRTVWVLSGVSLLNDASSEMIAPLMPIFLTAVLGAGPAAVGLIEGLADATSSVLKLVSGRLADRGVSTRKLVVGGYALSSLAKPLIAFAANWTQVLAVRFTDRIGKGVRTAPRDALLAASVAPELRGRAFGLHRASDHFGAMIGPLVAAALLATGVAMRDVFLLAGVFGLLTVGLAWFGLPAHKTPAPRTRLSTPLRWSALDRRVRGLLAATTLLALATMPEVLIVLWATEHGLAVALVPLVWAAAHAAKSLVAWLTGGLTDRFGPTAMLAIGWPLRILALLVLALSDAASLGVWLAFVFYCATLAATEPAERALIAASVPETQRGTAYGWFYLLAGVAALPGAWFLGTMWQEYGSSVALLAAAGASALACIAILPMARFTAHSSTGR